MAIADRIDDHQARCLPHLLALRVLTRNDPEAPFPWLARAEVATATEAILAEAEAEAASRETRAATGGGPGTGIFLDGRLSRLGAAAADAIAAAEAGDFTQLHRHLHRFETLTSAIWTVQDATRPAPLTDLSDAPPGDADTRRDRAGHHEQLRAAADAITAEPRAAMARVRQAYAVLTGEIWPHENAEETDLYPAVNRLLGGTDPTAAMSRAHAEISYQITRLGRLIAEIGDRAPDEADIADLRSTLYGLHAILRLHTAQEDEAYLSLGEEEAAPGGR